MAPSWARAEDSIVQLEVGRQTALMPRSSPTPISECETCADIADRGFESGPGEIGKVAAEFLNHVIQSHTSELLELLVQQYAPAFLARRAMR